MKTSSPHYPSIAAFLSSRGLSTLLEVFVSAGIRNHDHLVGLAEMPLQDQEILLKSDMKLTSFEFRMVRVALTEFMSARSYKLTYNLKFDDLGLWCL